MPVIDLTIPHMVFLVEKSSLSIDLKGNKNNTKKQSTLSFKCGIVLIFVIKTGSSLARMQYLLFRKFCNSVGVWLFISFGVCSSSGRSIERQMARDRGFLKTSLPL